MGVRAVQRKACARKRGGQQQQHRMGMGMDTARTPAFLSFFFLSRA